MELRCFYLFCIFITLAFNTVSGKSCDLEPTGKPRIVGTERVGLTSMKLKIELDFPGASSWPDCDSVPFRLQSYTRQGKAPPVMKTFLGNMDELVVQKLESCTQYFFSVKVLGSNGVIGPASAEISNITDSREPTKAPVLKKVVPRGNEAMRVTWSYTKQGTQCDPSKPFHYVLYYESTEVPHSGRKDFRDSFPGNNVAANLGSLRPCTEYRIFMTIANFAERESANSNAIVVRTNGPDPSSISASPQLTSIARLPVDNKNKGQLYIQWDFNDKDVVCGYSFVIYAKAEGSDSSVEQPIWGGARDANVTGLDNCVVYEISMKAKNLDGDLGPEGNKLSERTSTAKPEGPPTVTSLSALEGDTGKLRIKWEFEDTSKLNCPEALGFTFTLHYRNLERGPDREMSSVKIPDNTMRSVHISGLHKCTEYEIAMGVVNAVGAESDLGNKMTKITFSDKPDIPPKILSVEKVNGDGTKLRVTWEFKGADQLHCDPSKKYGYRIFYSSGEDSSYAGNVNVTNQRLTTKVLTGLHECTEYSIEMTVINIAEVESDRSAAVKQVTDSENPTIAPELKSVVPVKKTTDQLLVTWTFKGEKELHCDPKKGYIVHLYYVSKLDKKDAGVYNETKSSVTSKKLTGLNSCTQYTISMSVENALQHESARGHPMMQFTLAKKPKAPPEITSVTRPPGDITKLKVAWKFGGEDKLQCPPVLGYNFTIYYASEKDLSKVMEKVVSNKRPKMLVLSDLTPCTEYFVSMSVTNFAGMEGAPSQPFRQLTNSKAPTEAPKILSLTNVEGSTGMIHVSFQFSALDTLQCSPDKGYRFIVYYQSVVDPKDKGSQNASDPTAFASTISQLQSCTNYVITVAVRNAVERESPRSDPFNITTLSGTPNTPPTIKSVKGPKDSTTELVVTWIFSGQGGLSCNPLLGYDFLVYWWPIESPDDGKRTNVSDTKLKSMTITGLTPCTEYNVSMTVRNFVGVESALSVPVTTTTSSDRPGTPPKLTSVAIVPSSVTSLKVFWTFDGIYDLLCDPSKNYDFEVTYFPVDKPGKPKRFLVEDEASSSAVLESLTTCTSYNISMTVKNFVGRYSPPSNYLIYDTKTEKPGLSPVITSLSQVSNTTTELHVEWIFKGLKQIKCPKDKNYSYVIYYTADDGRGEVLKKTIEDKTSTMTDLSGLHPCSNYTVYMTVKNFAGVESNASVSVNQLTLADKPSRVPTITEVTNIPDSTTDLRVSWKIPAPSWEWLKCDPTRYAYEYVIRYVNLDVSGDSNRRKREAGDLIKVPQGSNEAIVPNLAPCTQYSLSVSVMNIAQKEGDPASASGLTSSEKPTVSPRILSLDAVGPTSLHITWESMADIPSDALKCDSEFGFSYVIHYSSSEDESLSVEVGSNETKLEITNLEPCMEYVVSVSVKNRAGVISDGSIGKNITGAIPTGPVSSIQSESTPNVGIRVTWLPPHSHCNVSSYKIRYAMILYDQCETRTPSWVDVTWTENGTDDSPSLNVDIVEPFSTYQIMIIPITHEVIEGEVTNISIISYEQAPNGTLKLSLTDGRKRRLVAKWDELPCGQRRGRVWYEYKLWILGEEIPSEWSVTYETTNVFRRLKGGATYNMTVRPVTSAGVGPETTGQVTISKVRWLIPFLILLAILCLVLLVLLILWLCKRRKRWKKYSVRRMSQQDVVAVVEEDDTDSDTILEDEAENRREDPASNYENQAFDISAVVISAHHYNQPAPSLLPPISMEYFPLFLKERRNRDGELFRQEFKNLNPNEHGSRIEAMKQENQMKNRNSNLVTYDISRVNLEVTKGDPHSDYINASYIPNCKRDKYYIATQGPNSVTKGDFWRMVIQEDSNTIVMLCNLVENKRVTCNRYWPKRGTKNAMFGNMSIILKREEQRPNFVIREFTVVEGKHAKRKVTQFHYTGWPEVGVPRTSTNLWQLIDLANKNMKHKKGKGPMVVHCSSGCGRTGTFIAMDAMQKEFEKVGKIDIFAFVDQMRRQRTSMVQEQAQYEFIFCAIFEKYFVRDAVMRRDTFTDTLKAWQLNGNLSRLYKMFDFINPTALNINSSGHDGANIGKNRYQDNIPRNDYRPYLITNDPHDSEATDYINASFFNGYKDKDLFVATQDPLPNTVIDFWRLVWDYNCLTLVMLEQRDPTDSTTPPYWPYKGSLVSGPFTIRMLDKSRILSHAITERHLSVTLKPEKETDTIEDYETREVKQICIKDWPRRLHVPITPAAFLATCEMVNKLHQHKPSSKILLHCRNGIGRCGIFIAVYNAIAEIKEKEEVNMFAIVSELRNRRPMMVDSLARFTFCFEAIDHYLKEFDTYSQTA